MTMERAVVPGALLCLVLVSGIGGIKVIIPKPTYEYARGDNITLPCTFLPKTPNPPLVIVTWSVLADPDIQIVTYYAPSGVTDIKQRYENRVSVGVDVAKGTANLNLKSITLQDNEEFECRVMIPNDDEGTPAATARLVVLVAPSPPICKIQGKAEYGQNINLTCLSEEGSPPPTYKWDRRDVRNTLSPHDPRTTDKQGLLSLYNISKDTSGYYICTSQNKIRSATCNLTLSVLPPSMLGSVGSTAGIIGAVVAGLIALIIIIYCCCCRKKKKEDDYAMGTREEEGYYDKDSVRNGENRRPERPEDMRSDDESSVRGRSDGQDHYEDRSERDYDRRRDYDDRRSDYDDRRSDYDDRRSDYDRRYNDRNERYDDNGRYDDDRRYERRDPRYDDDRRYDDDDRRYDEPSDSRSPRRDYDD